MDLDLRTLETRDPGSVRLIQARIRAGELTQAHVELAASLGHAGALELEPDTDLVDWGDWNCRRRAIASARDLLDDTLPAAATAAFYASEAETVEDAEAEREWRRLRLAAYVLRETE